MSVSQWIWLAVSILLLLERLGKWFAVVRFFHRPALAPAANPNLVSILQPILSGDPLLPACLESNLRESHSYPVEFLWMVDENDSDGLAICRDAIARNPGATVRLLMSPLPDSRSSPKMQKLIQGLDAARGDWICVLDDDTVLSADALPTALSGLAVPQAGLVFGLPYYVSFGNLWSSLISCFVNSNSLMTYVPAEALVEPFTINGMFYVARRDVLESVGGFRGLEASLADDFAVAQRFRKAGYKLIQSAVRHPIRTTVAGPRACFRLIQRWFVFPRETLLRGLPWPALAVTYGLTLLPALAPLAMLIAVAVAPGWFGVAVLAGNLVLTYLIFCQFNVSYLCRSTPWRWSWLVPVVQLLVPLAILAAMVLPQRIVWRGHVMWVKRGGTFEIERRREA